MSTLFIFVRRSFKTFSVCQMSLQSRRQGQRDISPNFIS
nr:MAG TPA: hypothetical protein [Herelleviridae sp.]